MEVVPNWPLSPASFIYQSVERDGSRVPCLAGDAHGDLFAAAWGIRRFSPVPEWGPEQPRNDLTIFVLVKLNAGRDMWEEAKY